jgi:hypothetical protein
LKFYSRITNKPNSVIEEVKHEGKIIDRKRIAVFQNGVFETDDPKIIEKLKAKPEMFRTDKPWPKPFDWKETPEGMQLLKKGKELKINTKNIRKEYLEKLIAEKGDIEIASKAKENKELTYKEAIAKAKDLGIPTHKRKKEDILKDLKQKEVMTK